MKRLKALFSFLAFFCAFYGSPGPASGTYEARQVLDPENCAFLLRRNKVDEIRKGNWVREFNLEYLKRQFWRNGNPDYVGWEKFKTSQPGRWLKLTSGRSVRVLFLEADDPNAESLNISIGGIGNSVERFIDEDYAYISRLDFKAHDLFIETGGLTDFDEFMQTKSKPRSVIPIEDVAADVYEAIVSSQNYIRKDLQLKIPKSVNLIGLSAGGWFLQYFAAQSKYNGIIDQIVLQAPGGQSLDEYFNAFIRPLKDAAKATHSISAPFVDAINSVVGFGLQSAQSWALTFGFPEAMLPEYLSAYHELIRYMYPMRTPHQFLSDAYRDGASKAMGAAFKAFQHDPLRLQFATARVMGLAECVGENTIPLIPRSIMIHMIIGGRDMVVPPGLFANAIGAMMKRDQASADKTPTFSVAYFSGLEHDLLASPDPRVAGVTQGLLTHRKGMEIVYMDGDDQPREISAEEMIKILRSHEKMYIEVNQALLRPPK